MKPVTKGTRMDDGLGQSFVRLLIGDVLSSRERLATDDTQQNRRDTIRSTFAAIEGIVWMYREHVREIAGSMGVLTPTADMALRDKTFAINEKGAIAEQSRFLGLTTIIRLVTKQAQLIEPEAAIDFDDAGWNQLRSAIEIRNRVTHPKGLTDLFVDTAELQIVADGFVWLVQSTAVVEAAITHSFHNHVDAFRDILHALKIGDAQAIADYRKAVLRGDD